MKIFVAYGFNPRDAWIPAKIFPLIQAFGSHPDTGEDLYGGPITHGVLRKVDECDALIAMLTRRNQLTNGDFDTHEWVLQEAAVAVAKQKPVLEVREKKVQPGGMLQSYQRIDYDPEDPFPALVEFVRALASWHSNVIEQPRLLPPDVSKFVKRYRGDPTFRCSYLIRRNQRQLPEVQVDASDIVPANEEVSLMLKNVRRGDLVMLQVQGRGEVWQSDFVNVDDLSIPMEKLP